MITERDRKIVEFVTEFKAVYSWHVEQVFFRRHKEGQRQANRTLRKLWQAGEIKRTKDLYTDRNIYYVGNRHQLRHKLLITSVYARMTSFELVEFIREYMVGTCQADAFARFRHGGREYLYFVEIQISHEPVDIGKYEKILTARLWPERVFPRVLVVSDRRQEVKSPVRIVQVKTDFSNWEEVTRWR